MAKQLLEMLLDSSTEEEDSDSDEELYNFFSSGGVTDFENPLEEDPSEIEIQKQNIIDNGSDEEFKMKFKFDRKTIQYLISEYAKSDFPKTNNGVTPRMSLDKEIYVFCWYLTSTSTTMEMAHLFSLSNTSVWRVIKRVKHWLDTLGEKFLKWPTINEIGQNMTDFEKLSRIPSVIGCIDTTHLRYKLPHSKYLNSQNYLSVHLQAVVDAQMKFININVGEPGSHSDSLVLFNSELYKQANEKLTDMFPNNSFILGDLAYPNLNWLITPFDENLDITDYQRRFNEMHQSARDVVKQAFGQLKTRFQRLPQLMDQKTFKDELNTVRYCCMLHNVCMAHEDYIEDASPDEEAFDQRNPEECFETQEHRREQLLNRLINSKVL